MQVDFKLFMLKKQNFSTHIWNISMNFPRNDMTPTRENSNQYRNVDLF